MTPRLPLPTEIPWLARVWYEGWQDAHAAILPEALARERTLQSFQRRLDDAGPAVRAVGPEGAPAGFCMVRHDELYQLYVSRTARGAGAAQVLLQDAEARLAKNGVERAWLACAVGNDRAARFYEKHGWHRAGEVTIDLPLSSGPFPLDVWRYEKTVERPG